MAVPCADWPVDESCSFGIPADPEDRTAVQAHAVTVASELLWRLTATAFGICPIVVRPCGRRCSGFAEFFPSQLPDGRWINITCECDLTPCGCCNVCSIKLNGPVAEVTEIKIDGVIVDDETYRIDGGDMLTRISGDCWPACQNLALPDTEVGTFSVAYDRGLPVPPGGQRAVAALAAEIVKSCTAGPCRLPARVQELVRQGERIQLINDVDFLRSGLTGLPEVDLWVVAVNPSAQKEPSTVWSPDLQPVLHHQTWP